jgi:DNA-binding FrmR family transcriptional regulator
METQLLQTLRQRMRRIEGQVKGVERMIEEGRDDTSILTQLSAIQSAARAAAELILLERMIERVRQSIGDVVVKCASDCPVCGQADDLAEALARADYSALLAEIVRLPLPHVVSMSQISADMSGGGENK